MQHLTITTQEQLSQLCAQLAQAPAIAFDTEFISERYYHPRLCLLQVATHDTLAVVDVVAIGDSTEFWKLLANNPVEAVTHSGREEVNFCVRFAGRPPANLFDTQLAAGLVDSEYPAGYRSLVWKLVGKRTSKSETRTDWQARPLSSEQIDYALEDVQYLLPMREKLGEQLESHGRSGWFEAEMADWHNQIEASQSNRSWRRVSGVFKLPPRAQAVAEQIWQWREALAKQRDLPSRRVLRDDLLVEIARRMSAEPKKIRAIRGLEHHSRRKDIAQLAEAVRRGLDATQISEARRTKRELPSQVGLLGQFLLPALTSICNGAQVSPSLVGTASEVRELVAYRLQLGDPPPDTPPRLATGWRAELVGSLLDDLLAGKMSVRIENSNAQHPLAFDRVPTK